MSVYLGIGLLLVLLALINPIRKRFYFPLAWVYGVVIFGLAGYTAYWIVTEVIPKLLQNPDMGSIITAGAFLLACIWGIATLINEHRSKTQFKRWATEAGYAGKPGEMTEADRVMYAKWLAKQ